MKTKHLIPLFLLTTLVCACNLTLPSSVKVKTKANYNFTVTKLNLSLSDYFNPTELIPTGEDSPFQIYDYNPASNTEGIQQYMLRMPIQEIPLDLSSFLSSTDLGVSLDAMSFSKDIEIPNVVFSGSENISVDDINTLINSGFAITGEGSSEEVNVTTSGSTFDYVKYKSGTFIFNFASNVTGKISIADSSKNIIASTNVTNSKTATISLNGVTIPNNASILFDFSAGAIPISDYPAFVAGIDLDSICEKVVGLTITNPLDSYDFDQDIDCSSLASTIESVTFGENSFFEFEETYPSGWTGISINPSVELTGAMVKNFAGKKGSLEDVVFTPGTVNAKIKVIPVINNATIIFGGSPTISYKVEAKTLKKVVVKADGISTDIGVDQPFPSGASDLIKAVEWNAGTGIKITYTNTFPTGNDFTLSNVKSDFIGLPSATKTMKADSHNEVIEFVTAAPTTSTINSSSKIDFSGSLKFPGNGSSITVSNVVAGEKYKIDVKIEPVLDWKSITVDNSATNVKDSMAIEFNKADIFKDIDTQLGTSVGTDLEISRLPVHLFCEIPNLDDIFTNPKFHGTIKAFIGQESGDTLVPVAGKTTKYLLNDEDMPTEKEPEIVLNDKNVQTKEITGGLTTDIASLLNESEEGQKICIDYNLSFATNNSDSITIEKAKIAGAGSTTIKLTAIIILPLDLNIKNAQNIDILEKFEADPNDIFGRTEKPDTTGLDEILSLVKYAEVSFWPEKKLFISDKPITLDIDTDGAGDFYSVEHINLNGGAFRLEDPKEAMKIYPLKPTVKLSIPAGRLAIPRDIALIAPVRVTVQTDGEIEMLQQGADNE